MYYITSAKELEKFVRIEVSRPKDYKNHFYPCYIEYDEPWDTHCCGEYYFMDYTPEKTIEIRKNHLKDELKNLDKQRAKINQELKKLGEISK